MPNSIKIVLFLLFPVLSGAQQTFTDSLRHVFFMDKRFQPFATSVICNFYFHFTTKPTGQGTGRGLSLAYHIVKAHGGEIKVNTKHEEGSEFIIQLRPN